jgi:Protein of unknown function (DUF2510)
MTSPRAPAGWYPDPSDAGVVRYWDGTAWTDLAAAPTQPLPAESSTSSEPPPEPPESVVRESSTPGWAKIGIPVLIAVLVIGIAVYVTNRSTGPAHPFGAQPRDERAVVELIEDARQEYADANHDLQRDAALRTRDARICALLGDGRVEKWTGQIYEIDSDGDGKGILGINIEPNTQVTNRDGVFSGADTLIPPGPLLDRVTELETGQEVTFSGTFVPDEDGPCFTNPRITQRQRIDKPLMVFRFRDVRG